MYSVQTLFVFQDSFSKQRTGCAKCILKDKCNFYFSPVYKRISNLKTILYITDCILLQLLPSPLHFQLDKLCICALLWKKKKSDRILCLYKCVLTVLYLAHRFHLVSNFLIFVGLWKMCSPNKGHSRILEDFVLKTFTVNCTTDSF